MSAETPLWAEEAGKILTGSSARRRDGEEGGGRRRGDHRARLRRARPGALPHQDGGRDAHAARSRAPSSAPAPDGENSTWPKPTSSLTVNGKSGRGAGRAAHAAHPLPARAAEPHRPAYRLRDQPLRRLHRRSRRQVGEVLHRVRRAGQRRRHPHHRRHGRCRRHAARAAGRLPRDARPAMRLLHAGHDHARLSAAAGEPEPDRGGNPPRHLRQSLPLHRLSEHRQGHSIRRRQAHRRACSRRPQNERHDPHLRRTRREAPRHGLQAQARRGHPLRPGQGQLRRRPEAARHALRRLRPLAARACAHQEDRHLQGRGRCPACSRC